MVSAARFLNEPYYSSYRLRMFSGNPIRTIEPEAFRWGSYESGMHV